MTAAGWGSCFTFAGTIASAAVQDRPGDKPHGLSPRLRLLHDSPTSSHAPWTDDTDSKRKTYSSPFRACPIAARWRLMTRSPPESRKGGYGAAGRTRCKECGDPQAQTATSVLTSRRTTGIEEPCRDGQLPAAAWRTLWRMRSKRNDQQTRHDTKGIRTVNEHDEATKKEKDNAAPREGHRGRWGGRPATCVGSRRRRTTPLTRRIGCRPVGVKPRGHRRCRRHRGVPDCDCMRNASRMWGVVRTRQRAAASSNEQQRCASSPSPSKQI